MFTISKSMLRRSLGLVLIAGIVTTIVVSRSANVRAEPEGNRAAAASLPLYSCRWTESEGGWAGVWSATSSNKFDAEWTKEGQSPVTATLRVLFKGDTEVRIYRTDRGTTRNYCEYEGTWQDNKRSVSGTYQCGKLKPGKRDEVEKWGPSQNWSARIEECGY